MGRYLDLAGDALSAPRSNEINEFTKLPPAVAANDPAEVTRTTLQAMHPPTVEGVPLSLVLDQADPEDYADLANPAVLEAFARSLVRHGYVVVPRQPETAARQAPSTVSCCECAHFRPDLIGGGSGIGRCAVNAWRKGQPALYPWAPRHCDQHQPAKTEEVADV